MTIPCILRGHDYRPQWLHGWTRVGVRCVKCGRVQR